MKPPVALVLLSLSFAGCQQSCARSWGGSANVDVEPGRKMVGASWKGDGELWYLTRPAREGETAEDIVYQQSKSSGLFEGKVVFHETAAPKPEKKPEKPAQAVPVLRPGERP